MGTSFFRVPDRIWRWIRAFFRLFRRTIPDLLYRGGSVYLHRNYDLTPAQLRAGLRSLQLPRRRRSFRGDGRLGLLRLFRIRRRLTWSRLSREYPGLEMGLEPRGAAGRLLLKALPAWGARTLQGFHEELLRNVAYPEFIRADEGVLPSAADSGRFYLLLRLLCRLRLLPVSEIRLRTVFLLEIQREPPEPPLPLEIEGNACILTGELFFYSKRWAFLNFSAGRIALLLRPAAVHLQTRDRPLRGYLVQEWQRPFSRRPNRIGRRPPNWYLHIHGVGRYILRAGRYGGFDRPFPFHPADSIPWLFFPSQSGTALRGYRLAGQFPINHLQQFHALRSLPFATTKERDPNFCEESSPPSPSPLHRALGALYISRLDLKAVDRFSVTLKDLLLRRPPLDRPPAETE